ncbi:MAG: DNA recombination protein RmuC [Candidatus Anaerobiospirillum pullicola]|uniref:DNA recombination protein RmuC n=1 Tax=Candidatus Anaerobiospirillum pullicola TaxID=2838451 RepID=A0A948TGD5_9GAMM|nr:DNA recombination protein RmuC [Candidatus Anaerobiospirillum pullicola]
MPNPNILIGIIAVLIVLVAICVFLIWRQSQRLNSSAPTTGDSSGNTELDAQMQAQMQALLQGQSVLLSKSEHSALIEQAAQLTQSTTLNTELKQQVSELTAALERFKEQAGQHELQLTTELTDLKSAHSHDQQALQEKEEALTALKAAQQEQLQQLKTEHTAQTTQLKTEQQEQLEQLKATHATALQKAEAVGADQLKACTERYENTINELKASQQQLLNELKNSQQQELAAAQKHATEQITALTAAKQELQQKNEELSTTLTEQNKAVATLKSEKESLLQLRDADAQRFAQAQAELEHRLNTMGEKLLKERSEALEKNNSEHMGQIISPLREELNTFRELLTTTQKTNSEQAGQLQNELKHLQEAQLSLSTQADQLSRALLQGAKSQGMWGEHQLERVLELAGLEQKTQYLREVAGVNSSNERGRADVVIPLPHHHAIVVDSKCSLTAYTDLINAEMASDKDGYEQALNRHIASLKAHIDELSKKDYQSYADFDSPTFVFMFVPIDQALAVALRHDPQLYDYAQKKNIALISPSLAVPALRVVSNLWVLAEQGEKLKQVAALADRIFLKCTKVCADFEGLLKARDSLNNNIDRLNTSLYEGRGNLRSLLSNFAQKAPALTAAALAEMEADLQTGLNTGTGADATANATTSNAHQPRQGMLSDLTAVRILATPAPALPQQTAAETTPAAETEAAAASAVANATIPTVEANATAAVAPVQTTEDNTQEGSEAAAAADTYSAESRLEQEAQAIMENAQHMMVESKAMMAAEQALLPDNAASTAASSASSASSARAADAATTAPASKKPRRRKSAAATATTESNSTESAE